MDETRIQELKTIQQTLAAAWIARDRATIERLIASDWMVTHVAGQRLTRADVLRDLLESSETRIESMHVDDVDVRLFGDTAVVTGRTHAQGVQAGVAFDVELRFTDVFVRRSNQWQAVASHATTIAPR
jgi:ketosteroid isomerase-like protein